VQQYTMMIDANTRSVVAGQFERMLTHSTTTRTMISLTSMLALASACTLRPASLEGDDEIGDDSDSDSDSESDSESGSETDSESDSETDSESESDSTETGEQGVECLTDEGRPAGRALLLDQDNDSALLFIDGTEQTLALGEPEQTQVFLSAAASEDQFVIARSSGAFEDAQSMIHVFDIATGESEWSRELQGWTAELWASNEGVSGVILGPENTSDGFVLAPAPEQSIELVGRSPLAAPHENRIVARDIDDGSYGWIDLAGNVWTPAQPQPLATTFANVDDDERTLEYVAEGDLGLEFVRAKVAGNATFPLPDFPGVIHPTFAAGDFRLLVGSDPDTQIDFYVRVDIESGEALLLEPELPIGRQWFEGCYGRQVALDPDGALVFVLHDGASAQTFAWQPEIDQWTATGIPVSAVAHVGMSSTGSAFHVTETADDLCMAMDWAEPPIGALLGDSVQLFRHEPALAIELPNAPVYVSLDAEERCAAYLVQPHWRVLDLDGSVEVGIASGNAWLWLQ
jgi:hypothetical protein